MAKKNKNKLASMTIDEAIEYYTRKAAMTDPNYMAMSSGEQSRAVGPGQYDDTLRQLYSMKAQEQAKQPAAPAPVAPAAPAAPAAPKPTTPAAIPSAPAVPTAPIPTAPVTGGSTTKPKPGTSIKPKPVTPTTPATGGKVVETPAQIREREEAERREQRERDAEEKKKADAAAAAAWKKVNDQQLASYNTAQKNSIDRAWNDFSYAVRQEGANPNDYRSDFEAYVNKQLGGAPEFTANREGDYVAPDFNKYLSGGGAFAEDTLGNIRTKNVNTQRGSLGTFFDEGFDKYLISDTADDPYIDSILNPQFNDAQLYLDRALRRGSLSQGGYDAGLAKLTESRSGANARLQSTGGGILEGYRGDLRGIAENAYKAADSYDFANPKQFDPEYYFGSARSKAASSLEGLEGALRNAVGGEQFFNPSSLIQYGGTQQGLFNPATAGSASELYNAFANRKSSEEQKRGLGTQGSF